VIDQFGTHTHTIYDRAFLDLRNEPIILSIPPMGDRKYWFPIGDMRHDFSTHLSWNTVGARGGDFALCPPGWKGVLPDGVQRIDVSTPIVWILGRYAVDGPDDIPAATALQDKVRLVSLSRWGSSDLSRPAIDPASYPVFTRADLSDARKYFTTLNAVLRLANGADMGMEGWLREIRLAPAQRFD